MQKSRRKRTSGSTADGVSLAHRHSRRTTVSPLPLRGLAESRRGAFIRTSLCLPGGRLWNDVGGQPGASFCAENSTRCPSMAWTVVLSGKEPGPARRRHAPLRSAIRAFASVTMRPGADGLAGLPVIQRRPSKRRACNKAYGLHPFALRLSGTTCFGGRESGWSPLQGGAYASFMRGAARVHRQKRGYVLVPAGGVLSLTRQGAALSC